MKQKNQSEKKLRVTAVFLIVSALIALSATIAVSIAALRIGTTQRTHDITVSNFFAEGEVGFFDGSKIQAAQKNASGLIAVNLSNPDATNYLGKLRVNVKFRGRSPAYIRVRVFEQWMDTTTDVIQAGSSNTPYLHDPSAPKYILTNNEDADAWYDNRAIDLYYYYAKAFTAATSTTSGDEFVVIPLIIGVDSNFLDGQLRSPNSLSISVVIEAVQPNRYKAFWNIGRLPWR